MPPNIPFLPEAISQFLAMINAPRRTEHEAGIDDAVAALKQTFPDRPGVLVPGQSVSFMNSGAEEANFLALETRLLSGQHAGPMKAIDIGTFAGRSAMAIARAMPEGSKVITCELDSQDANEYLAIAKKYWKDSGLDKRIELRQGDALKTMEDLTAHTSELGTYDLIFIDAKKEDYPRYYEEALKLLRPGGLVILDNMLWSGSVADEQTQDSATRTLRELNKKISTQENVEAVLLGFGDGVMVVEKCAPGHKAAITSLTRHTPSLEKA